MRKGKREEKISRKHERKSGNYGRKLGRTEGNGETRRWVSKSGKRGYEGMWRRK